MSARNALTLILMLLTGLILGQLLDPSLGAQPLPSARARSNQAAAVAFYESVNRYLESGDPEAFATTLDSGFHNHSGLGGDTGTAGFVRYWAAMRAAYPDMRLDVTSMSPQGDIVAVALATTAGTAAVSGIPIPDRAPPAPGYEQLRIVDGRIAERWASATLPPQFESVTTVETQFLTGWFVECAMEQLTLEPGAQKAFLKPSLSLVIASTGSLAVDIDQRDGHDPLLMLDGGVASQTPLSRGVRTALAADSVIQFTGGESYRILNVGQEPATAIIVEIQYHSPEIFFFNGQSVRGDPTIDDSRRAPAELMPMKTTKKQPNTLSLLRVETAPNELLPVHTVSGLELVLVASGTLEVESFSGFISFFGPDGRKPLAPGDRRTLSTGLGTAASNEALLSYRVAGDSPAVLWLVTLVPVPTAGE